MSQHSIKSRLWSSPISVVIAACVLAVVAFGPGLELAEAATGGNQAFGASTKFFGLDESVANGATESYAFGRTMKVASIMVGDPSAGLKDVLGGQQYLVLMATAPGQAAPYFLWEGSRSVQLNFIPPVPLTALNVSCMATPDGCDFMLTATGF